MDDTKLSPESVEQKLISEQTKKLEEIKKLTPEELAEKVNMLFNHHYAETCNLIDASLSGNEAKRVLKLALYYPFEGHRLKAISDKEKTVLLHAYRCVDAKSAMLVDSYAKAMQQSADANEAKEKADTESLAQNSSEPKIETNGEANG